METYEQLLEKAYKNIKVAASSGERFEVPKVKGQIEGKNTIIINILDIANYIRRPVEHLAKYLLKELAAPGYLDKERLILKTKLTSNRVNEKLLTYVEIFVICPECKKPDTEIISEHGIKFKHCLACGARTPIRSKTN